MQDIDLSNSTGTSEYRLAADYQPGEPRYKRTRSGSPLKAGRKLTYIIPDETATKFKISIQGATVDATLAAFSRVKRFAKQAMDTAVRAGEHAADR